MEISGRTSSLQLEQGKIISNGVMVKTEPSSPIYKTPHDNPKRKRNASSNLENINSKRHDHSDETSSVFVNDYEASMMVANPCCVCSDKRVWPKNLMFYCDGCKIAVHQVCYGITVDHSSQVWLCKPCEAKEKSTDVECQLCPKKGGALKKTDADGYTHILCALFIPEVMFGDPFTMEPIILTTIPLRRSYNKICYICKYQGQKTSNAVMDCNKQGCKNQFHATCAQAIGLLFVEPRDCTVDVKYVGYCRNHYATCKEMTAIPVCKTSFGDSDSSECEFNSRASSSFDDSTDDESYSRRNSRNVRENPFWNVSSQVGLVAESRVFRPEEENSDSDATVQFNDDDERLSSDIETPGPLSAEKVLDHCPTNPKTSIMSGSNTDICNAPIVQDAQESVEISSGFEETKKISLQNLQQVGIDIIAGISSENKDLEHDRDDCEKKLQIANEKITKLTQQVAHLLQVVKVLAGQVNDGKPLTLPTKMTRSIGLQVNQIKINDDKELKFPPIQFKSEDTKPVLCKKETNATQQNTKSVSLSSNCPPISKYKIDECVQSDDDIIEIPITSDGIKDPKKETNFLPPSVPTAHIRQKLPPLPPIPTRRVDPQLKPIPPKPFLEIKKIADYISASWSIDGQLDHAEIASYRVWMLEESTNTSKLNQWKPLKIVNGKLMACKITIDPPESTSEVVLTQNWYHFAVRAIDVHGRSGPYSNVASSYFP